MRREQLENNTKTTLNGAITDVATTVTVADGSGFPAEGDYRIICNEEIMIVTARSGNDLTVTRGAESTTASAQSGGAAVRMILTAGGLNKWMDDITGGYSDRPPYRFLDENNATLTSSDFTWTNQSTASVIDENYGGITMQTPSTSGVSLRLMTKTAPAAPWTLTGKVQYGPGYTFGSTIMGICARESSSGKIQTCGLQIGGDVGAWQYTNATTYNTRVGAAYDHRSDNVWLRIEDNNTNIIMSVSSDGVNFMQIGSQARGTFPTGSNMDEIGFFVNSEAADANAYYHFNAWITE